MKYKHNDYYGYINKIQEKAISNPQWFWSNSEDALQARTWLRNNGAQSIIDDIYNNTPEEMRMSIPSTMLSKEQREGRVLDYQREHTNKTAEKVFEGGIALAGAPALISSFAAAPMATAYGLIGGRFGTKWGSKIGSKIGNNIITTDTADNGYGSIIHTNRDSGSKIGGLIGGATVGTVYGSLGNSIEKQLLSKYGYNGGVSFKDMLYELKHKDEGILPGEYEGWYHPAERYSNTQRALDAAEYSKRLDAIQWIDNFKQSPTDKIQFKTFSDVTPEGKFVYDRIPLDRFNPNTGYKLLTNNVGDTAIKYKSVYDIANKTSMNVKTRLPKVESSKIILDPDISYYDSYNNKGTSVIGMQDLDLSGIQRGDLEYGRSVSNTIAHEIAHNYKPLNTRVSKTDTYWNDAVQDSPYYGSKGAPNDYRSLSDVQRKLLSMKVPKTKFERESAFNHDSELSEGFSDLQGWLTEFKQNGLVGKNNKVSIPALTWERIRTSNPINTIRNLFGKSRIAPNRFQEQRTGFINQYKALNYDWNDLNGSYKNGGILKGQLGLSNLPVNPNVIKRTYDKVNNWLNPIGKWESEHNVKANASLGPLMWLENPEAFAGVDLETIDPAHVGAKFLKEPIPKKIIPSTTKISKPVVKQPTTKMEKGLHTYVKNKHPEDLANWEKYLDEYMKYWTKKKK